MYKKESDELLLKKFDKDIKIDEDQAGVISCAMESKHKVMARDIVRYMVAQSNEKYLKLQKENLQYSLDYLKKSQRELTDSVKNIGEELVQFFNRSINLRQLLSICIIVFLKRYNCSIGTIDFFHILIFTQPILETRISPIRSLI